MSDSFATAPRLDSTTLTLRIYPKPPTDHPPSSLQLLQLLSPFLRRLSHPLTAATYSRALTLRRPTISVSSACLPACLPVVPVSLFLTPSSSSWLGPRERRLRARVASPKTPQTPAGTRLHPVALSSIVVIIVVVVLQGTRQDRVISRNWDSARRRCDIVDSGKCPWFDGHCGTLRRSERCSINAFRVGKSPTVESVRNRRQGSLVYQL